MGRPRHSEQLFQHVPDPRGNRYTSISAQVSVMMVARRFWAVNVFLEHAPAGADLPVWHS